jgi:hypothetical protein
MIAHLLKRQAELNETAFMLFQHKPRFIVKEINSENFAPGLHYFPRHFEE